MLLHPPDQLASTDVAAHAMHHIRTHGKGIRDVHLLARRGPVQVGGCGCSCGVEVGVGGGCVCVWLGWGKGEGGVCGWVGG